MNAVKKIFTDEPPSKIFIQRCEDFKLAAQNPETALPTDWDGVFTAASK